MSEENVEIVRRLFELWREGMERGDAGAMFDSEELADDAEFHNPPAGGISRETYRGREGWLKFQRIWTEDLEDFSVELERVIDAGGDRVVGLLLQTATGKGSGVPFYELKDGRVIRVRSYIHPAEALEAAGLRE
jgi:ketosteroid isomerase-like protein